MVLKTMRWKAIPGYWDNLTVVLHSVLVWLLLLELSHFHLLEKLEMNHILLVEYLLEMPLLGHFLIFWDVLPSFAWHTSGRLDMALSVDSS